MSQTKDINIKKAKGRPMLTWVGKKPLTSVRAYPAQHIERFAADGQSNPATDWSDWPDGYEPGGLLFHGDNKDVLAHLLANGFRGQVKLIYIDPPFDSGADYVRKVQLRGVSGSQKIDGEEYTLGEQIQYEDIWANDNYLQFMYERLLMLRELLSPDGNFWLHVDWHRNHQLKVICDEVFGPDNFVSEVVWSYGSPSGGRAGGTKLVKNHDMILHYAKSYENRTENKVYLPYSEKYVREWFKYKDEDGRQYRRRMRGLDKRGENVWERQYLDESKGMPAPTVWTDLLSIYADPRAYKGNTKSEIVNFPTQKPRRLLARIMEISSSPEDLVLDSFIGSGTTATVAQKLGRRWIGCDINKSAIQTTAKRLQAVMTEQAASAPKQQEPVENEDADPAPCQFSFSTWRVNDYDLQVQHNEAVKLACEYIGVTRNRADGYFDGTRGGRLVKIVPFNHPFTPLDLEDLKAELANRPEEERDIEMVCLGMELSAQAAVDDHNRHRSRGPNRVYVIELRTDDKYGGFIEHEPMTASIHVERDGETLRVKVIDVLSPTIVKRLNMEEGLFKAQIGDWRAMVDAVMIDTSHDGEVFNIAWSDVPEKKSDLVAGEYELDAPPAGAIVAVKIIDRLGEETVVTRPV